MFVTFVRFAILLLRNDVLAHYARERGARLEQGLGFPRAIHVGAGASASLELVADNRRCNGTKSAPSTTTSKTALSSTLLTT